MNRSTILTLTITATNIGELDHLSEYTSLQALWCSDNQLTVLPDLPATLQVLGCSNNQLMALPDLPDTLEYFGCGGNQLTDLPDLPDTLQYLECHGNPFELDIYNQPLEEIRKWQQENPRYYEPVLK